MRSIIMIIIALVIISLAGPSAVNAAHENTREYADCLFNISLSDEAEREEGGMLFKASLHVEEQEHEDNTRHTEEKTGSSHSEVEEPGHDEVAESGHDEVAEPGHDDSDDHLRVKTAEVEKEESHGLHKGLHGGIFFMAPNKIHHIEGVYSEKCGFSLIIYNAYTRPVSIKPYKAFVKFIPYDEDEMEAVRFLEPTEDGSVLRAAHIPEFHGAYELELHLKFAGSHEPAMFNFSGSDGS